MIKPPLPGELDAMARQYWNTWSEMLGRPGASAGPASWGLPAGMGGAINNPFAGNPFAASLAGLGGFNSAMPPGLSGFDPGAHEWFQQMQRLAADFSNGSARAADVAQAWREAMGKEGAGSLARVLRSMHGGLAGDSWLEQMRPMLESLLRPLRDKSAEWLHRPAFGPMREHQERLQALALAWQDWDQRNEAFNQLLGRVGQDAFARFEVMLEECDAPGKRLESARALFDLWIDAAEEAWAEVAFSEDYRKAYGEMSNAMMRLRLGLQGEVERFAGALGMPGRTEVDALARKVAALEREQYLARRAAAQAGKAGPAGNAGRTAPPPAVRPPVAAPIEAAAVAAAAKAKPSRSQAAGKPRKTSRAATASARRAPAASAARPAAKPVAKPTAKPAAKPTAKPVAKAGSRLAARPATKPVAKAAAKPVAKPAPAAGKAAPKPAAPARQATAKPGAATTPAPARRAPAQVVSMKDWVSRNLPGIEPPVAPARRGKSGRK